MVDRRRTVALAAMISFLLPPFAANSAEVCNFPDPVFIPNGKTATESEMIEADSAIKQYMSQLERYTKCVESEVSATRRSASDRSIEAAKNREETASRELNRAAVAIEDVAERFNQAIADYTSRNRK